MDPKPTCSIVEDGKPCSKPHYGKGMCNMHWRRNWKHGSPLVKRKKLVGCSVVVDGVKCPEPHRSLGMCSTHYTRNRNHGDPLVTKSTPNGAVPRFVEDVLSREPNGKCVLWPFYINGETGYGQIIVNGKMRTAQNHMLRLAVGEPEPGQEACHAPHEVCGRRNCVAPWHLRWGTRVENHGQKESDGTLLKGEQIVQSKLTAADVLRLRAIKGRSCKSIGEEFGIAATTVSRIQRRITWKHI